MRKDTLYITLSRDITSYTITSGQRAIATNVNYSVTIESPTLTTNLSGRDVSVIISDTDGNTLTTATTFYPDTKNPYKAVTGSLLLDGEVYTKFFDGKPVDTAVRLPIVIRDKSATLLSSDIVVMNGGESAEPSASDETVAGLVNAIRFYDLAEFKSWLEGTKTRDDGLLPTDIVVGQWVHTQNDGSFICKELIGAEPSVAKNFTAIVTQFPLTGTLKMNPDNGVGLSVYSGDVYNESEATSFSTDAITYKGEAFTFNAGDNQVARQKDNYALENRVNSKMDATLAAIKADNDETYNDMLPVMNTTVEARDRAETAASNAKASETRAVSAETNAATSEQNAEAYKKSAAVSEANAGLYRQQALAYAQKAETEAKTATDKATEAYDSASDASTSANEALAYKNDAGDSANAARLSAEASASSAESSATSAAASKSSAETAAQSESIAVGSAAAAASSESTASQYKDTAVSASSLAVTSKDSASNFADASAASASAAASSASASAASAAAAKQSETDLADAVATAESLDGRITLLETGVGAYKIQSRDVVPEGKPVSADVGKVIYFDGVDAETTSTLKVMNRVPFAQKVCPAPIASSSPSMCAVGCFDYVRNKKYIVFMTSLVVNPIGYLYELSVVNYYSSNLTFKSKLATSYYSDESVGAAYWCRNVCVHDGYVFYTRRHYNGGPYLTICEVETGTLVSNLDLDPKDAGGIYVNSAIWYNPLSGHICVLSYAHSLASGETWSGGQFIRVFNWDSETRTLSDIPDGDSPVTMVDVTDAVTEGLSGTGWNRYGSTWPIRDQVFLSIRGENYTALFHATADDRIEPCYEWDVEYAVDESGVTRPVWQTQAEEWTDADGNTQTIQNYINNYTYDHCILPKMTKGRLLKFMCTADYDGVPSGTWSANPVFYQTAYSFFESGESRRSPEPHWYYGGYNSLIALTDGVVQWAPLAGYKFVRREAFNSWYHLIVDNRSPQYKVSFFRRNEETGVYLLNDIRKGSARKFSGWLPKSGNYLSSVGAQQVAQGFANLAVTTQLTAAQSGTPLSRLGMVSNVGTDSAAMTPLPMTGTYSSDWWIASMLPYCAWGFFGNVWMTTYDKTIGGVL